MAPRKPVESDRARSGNDARLDDASEPREPVRSESDINRAVEPDRARDPDAARTSLPEDVEPSR